MIFFEHSGFLLIPDLTVKYMWKDHDESLEHHYSTHSEIDLHVYDFLWPGYIQTFMY